MKKISTVVVIILIISVNSLASPAVWDFDGDGKTDLVITRYQNNVVTWFILKSSEGFYSRVFGNYTAERSDSGESGDFNGDGKWDIGILRNTPNDNFHHFYILNQQGTGYSYFQWGLKTDQPLLQDYDGDGKTDFGVYRGGWWYIQNSSDGSFHAEKFGRADTTFVDEPIYGDYDGDGKADLAVVRYTRSFLLPDPMTFIVKQSSDGNWRQFTFGDHRGDIVVPGDYDGDGKTDIAVYGGRSQEYGSGRWQWIRSSDNQYVSVRFGYPGYDERPVPGDYDGDGKTDPAVYRRGTTITDQEYFGRNYFFILGSSSGLKAVQWGNPALFDYTPMTQMNSN